MKNKNWLWAVPCTVALAITLVQVPHLSKIPKMESQVASLQTQLDTQSKLNDQLSNELEYKGNILNKKIKEAHLKQQAIEKTSKKVKDTTEQLKTNGNKLKNRERALQQQQIELNKKKAQLDLLQEQLEKSKSKEAELKKQLETSKIEKAKKQNEEKQVVIASSRTFEPKLLAASVSQANNNSSDDQYVSGNFEVTYYNINGTTASGRKTTDGTTIAVDPSVIPLGSWVKLTFPNGKSAVYRADDTGSAVKGKVIDIYKNASTSTLRNLGRVHNVKVSIIDPA